MRRTVQFLRAACIQAGVDAELIFTHWDEADVRAYRTALRDGAIKAADLPRWMESTARTIRDGRCLCRACRADTGRAVA